MIGLSETEYEVMDFLWTHGPASFRDITEWFEATKNNHWKKQTVNTFVYRLKQKELVTADETARYAIYKPTKTKEEYLEEYLEYILNKFDNIDQMERIFQKIKQKRP